MTEQIKILYRRLECISEDLKVLWIALMFSMNLGGNRRWVLLITAYKCDLLNPLKKVCVSWKVS